MTSQRVDFYLLNESMPDGKLRAACRLAQKVLARGYTAYIQAGSEDQASRLDELMWTFDQGSFVPHRLDGDTGYPAPIIIGCDPPDTGHRDVLVALADDVPEHFHVYRRIADVVDNTGPDKQRARKRYKAYKDRGCQLETHHINP